MSSTSFSGESEIMDCETASLRSSSSSSLFASHKKDVLFVALGNDLKEHGSVLIWALNNLQGMERICVLYVHHPAQKIPMGMGPKVPIYRLDELQVRAYHDKERLDAYATLDEYIAVCRSRNREAEKICIETNSVEKGLVQLISENGVKRLVMGAAANSSYSPRMKELRSRKAKCVSKEAPSFCQISFVCDGHLICTRESSRINVHNNSRDLLRVRYNNLDGSRSPSVKCSSSHDPADNSIPEHNEDNELYDRIDQLLAEVKSLRKEVYDESARRVKAERDAINANRRAKASEMMHTEEFARRIEIEEEVAKSKEEAEGLRSQFEELMEQLRVAKEESISHLFSAFSFSEIEEATRNFSKELQIGKGGYGTIYKCSLRHTEVAIKILHLDGSQGPLEFQQEVSILSKLRHPNIITLIGACPEKHALVYEYLPNGSLEDRLNCKNNTSPLPWQTRIRIAVELCSALMFLHHYQPQGVVHGDLKPANVLLDANFVTKLSDFGICRVLPQRKLSINDTTRCLRTGPKGSFAYIDPEFLKTSEITTKSDVYALGIILLRLLTGRPAVLWRGEEQPPILLRGEVKDALGKKNLKDLLDPTAGDWPFVHAKQLASIAIQCSNKKRSARPDLASVLRVLEPMRVGS